MMKLTKLAGIKRRSQNYLIKKIEIEFLKLFACKILNPILNRKRDFMPGRDCMKVDGK